MALSTPTNSISVELLVLIYCLQDKDINNAPFPKVNTAQYGFSNFCVPQIMCAHSIGGYLIYPITTQVGYE